jgi:hypothetical protein
MAESEISELDALIAFASADSRVCPQPRRWQELWEMLSDRKPVGAGSSPSAPLILAAWWDTSDADKHDRLLYHIRYAAEHGALEQVAKFLRNLREEDWYHFGE